MHQARVEIGVGAFVLLAILALAFLAIQVSGLSLANLNRSSYTLTAEFHNVAGLSERARVSIAGVNIGHVESIRLDPITARAVVEMSIDSEVNWLTEDSIASIKTSGILGDQYVSLSVGGAPEVLEDGDRIRDTQSALVLEDLIGRFVTGSGRNGAD